MMCRASSHGRKSVFPSLSSALRPITNNAAFLPFALSTSRIARLRSAAVRCTAFRQLKSSIVIANCGAAAGLPNPCRLRPSATAEAAAIPTKSRRFILSLLKLVRSPQICDLKRQAYVGLNLLWLKFVAAAKQKQLIPSGIGASAGITFVKRKHTVIKGLANRRLVLTAQDVLPRKLRPLSKINVLIAERRKDFRHQAFGPQRKMCQEQICRLEVDDRLIMCRAVPAGASGVNVIEHSGLNSTGFAVHHVLNLFAVTLVEEGEAIESGNVIPGSFGAERPAELRRCRFHNLRSLSRFLSPVEHHQERYDDADGNRPQS